MTASLLEIWNRSENEQMSEPSPRHNSFFNSFFPHTHKFLSSWRPLTLTYFNYSTGICQSYITTFAHLSPSSFLSVSSHPFIRSTAILLWNPSNFYVTQKSYVIPVIFSITLSCFRFLSQFHSCSFHITFTYPFYFHTPRQRQIIWGSLLNLSTAEDYSGLSSILSIRASSQVWHELAVYI